MTELQAKQLQPSVYRQIGEDQKAKKPQKMSDESLKQACNDFESLFLLQLLKQMRQAIPKSGFLDGGNTEKIVTEMMDGELAQNLSQAGGIGLSRMLYDSIRLFQGQHADRLPLGSMESAKAKPAASR
jgi:flagellar protein FlgJ